MTRSFETFYNQSKNNLIGCLAIGVATVKSESGERLALFLILQSNTANELFIGFFQLSFVVLIILLCSNDYHE